jgi:nucleoside-diphosphate-sugar epimerase
MRVLVTGGGGFIGSHLIEHQIRQGHAVRTIDLHTEKLSHLYGQPSLEIIRGDITNNDLSSHLVSKIDVIYHLASAHLDVSLSEDDYWQVNVEATKNLLKAAKEAGVQRFVHCSTNGVVGEIKKPPADETTTCRPTNIYEKTKLAGEEVVKNFGRENNFHVIIARPAWVYGPRCPRTEKLIRTIGKQRFLMFGSGKTLRHPIYIDDFIDGIERCALADVPSGEIYFLAGEEVVTISSLINLIAELQGVSPPRISLPLTIGKTAGIGVQSAFKLMNKRPPFSRRSLDFFIKDNAYDIRKAQQELNFEPQINLRDGLNKTSEWLSERISALALQ